MASGTKALRKAVIPPQGKWPGCHIYIEILLILSFSLYLFVSTV